MAQEKKDPKYFIVDTLGGQPIMPITEDLKLVGTDLKTGDVEQVNSEGWTYEVVTDSKKAFQVLLKKATEGDMLAANELGCWYIEGKNIAKNTQEGLKWFKTAAEAGQLSAMYNLGRFLLEGQTPSKPVEAAVWLKKAAKRGHMHAMYELGMLLQNNPEPGPTEACQWFEEAAAKHSHVDAMLKLGELLAGEEKGVTPDIAKAYKWLSLAAGDRFKNPSACYYLADSRFETECRKNSMERFTWLKRAAELHHPVAECEIGLAHYGRHPEWNAQVPKDEKEGFKWLSKAVSHDHSPPPQEAIEFLSSLTYNRRNEDLAWHWWTYTDEWMQNPLNSPPSLPLTELLNRTKSFLFPASTVIAQTNDPNALYNYACSLKNQPTEALKFYLKAAKLGHPLAKDEATKILGTLKKSQPSLEPSSLANPARPVEPGTKAATDDTAHPRIEVKKIMPEKKRAGDDITQYMSRVTNLLKSPSLEMGDKQKQVFKEISDTYENADISVEYMRARISTWDRVLDEMEAQINRPAAPEFKPKAKKTNIPPRSPSTAAVVASATAPTAAPATEVKQTPRAEVKKELEQLSLILGWVEGLTEEDFSPRNLILARAALWGAIASTMETISSSALVNNNVLFPKGKAYINRDFIFHDRSTYEPIHDKNASDGKKKIDPIVEKAKEIKAYIEKGLRDGEGRRKGKKPSARPPSLAGKITETAVIDTSNYANEITLANRECTYFTPDDSADPIFGVAVNFVHARLGAAMRQKELAENTERSIRRSADAQSAIGIGRVVRHYGKQATPTPTPAKQTPPLTATANTQASFFAHPHSAKNKKKAPKTPNQPKAAAPTPLPPPS